MKAAFFTYVWPEPVSSAAGVRTYELMESLLARGWEIAAVSPCRDNPFKAALAYRGVTCFEQGPNDSSADELLARLNPDLVVFDRFVMEEQFGWRVRERCPRAAVVIDTQDLHFVRRARERALHGGASLERIAEFRDMHPGEDLTRELSSLYRADLALVVSEWEKELLLGMGVPESQLVWLPLFARSPARGEGAREGLAFLGNFRHPPNLDGALWLARELWPHARAAAPGLTLHFYGAYPPSEISALDGKNGIRVHGPVADHRSALAKHAASVAPLRFGAGIKGKVLESWCTGTPVIGTEIAFEGMGDKVGLEFRDKESFREAVSRLSEDSALQERLGVTGLAHAASFFSGHDERWAEIAESLLEDLPIRREKNLVGRLLTHARANATKYFSRWIEEKERLKAFIVSG